MKQQPTPGCPCRQCRELKDGTQSRSGAHSGNMGRVQRDPNWQAATGTPGKWQDYGHSDHLRGHEASDRAEREAYGRELPAAYRHLLGPTPVLHAGDREGARTFLTRVEDAINMGGWTRSEWARLYRMRDKWRKRATGADPRFDVAGNKSKGVHLTPLQTANVKMRKLIEETKEKLRMAFKSGGD